jgi:hypothetical protein
MFGCKMKFQKQSHSKIAKSAFDYWCHCSIGSWFLYRLCGWIHRQCCLHLGGWHGLCPDLELRRGTPPPASGRCAYRLYRRCHRLQGGHCKVQQCFDNGPILADHLLKGQFCQFKDCAGWLLDPLPAGVPVGMGCQPYCKLWSRTMHPAGHERHAYPKCKLLTLYMPCSLGWFRIYL